MSDLSGWTYPRLESHHTKHLAMAHAARPNLIPDKVAANCEAAHIACTFSASAIFENMRLTVHEDLSDIEKNWRAFEQTADCTAFQTFDWLATWQHHIGRRNGVKPVVVIGRDAANNMLLLLPLSIRWVSIARELTWLGTELCDYNAPLLSANFSAQVDAARFLRLWRAILQLLQSMPTLRYDVINLEKMPPKVGDQANPMVSLPVTENPSGTHSTHLMGTWEEYYEAKRSSTTRRRDRSKRKRLAESGEVRLVNPEYANDIKITLDTLMDQKSRSFERMGVANIFARPGYREFYQTLATDQAIRSLAHVSRLEVGTTVAAVNLGLTFRDRYYYLLASHDDGELSRFGPGAAHLHHLFRHAIERKIRVFDFTIGDERYKRDWCEFQLKLFDHVSFATWRGGLYALPLSVTKRLKRRIKQTPLLWSAFRKSRSFLGRMGLSRQRPDPRPNEHVGT